MKSQKYEVSPSAERKQQIKCAVMSIFLFMYLLPDQSSPQQNPACAEIVSQLSANANAQSAGREWKEPVTPL